MPSDFKELMRQCIKFRDENNILRQDYLDFIRNFRNKGACYMLYLALYSLLESFNNLTKKLYFNILGNYSEDYLAAHLFTFFLDGYETSSIAFSYTLYELACNLDVQNMLKEEIDNVLETHKGIVSFDAIQEMSYLDTVLLGNTETFCWILIHTLYP